MYDYGRIIDIRQVSEVYIMAQRLISLATAVIFLIATVVSVVGELPWWIIVVAVLLFVGSISPALYSKVSSALAKRKQKKQERKLVYQHWGELRRLAAALLEVTESSRTEIASIINQIASGLPAYKQEHYDPQGMKQELHSMLSVFLSLLDSQVRNRNTFTLSAQLLDCLFDFWHYRLVMNMTRNLLRDLLETRVAVDKHRKDEYNKFRKWHIDLMDEYVSFVKKVNTDFQDGLARMTTYEPPPDLW